MYAMKLAADKNPTANTMENAVRCSKGDVFGRMTNPSKSTVGMSWAATPSTVKQKGHNSAATRLRSYALD
jgi:hypothetical protein